MSEPARPQNEAATKNSPAASLCYVVDCGPGTRAAISSACDGMGVTYRFFDSLTAMLDSYAAVRPDLIMIDTTVAGEAARRARDELVAANVDRPLCLMSGLNGLLIEEMRRSWDRSGLKALAVLAKPLRQQAIRRSVMRLVGRSAAKPPIGITEVLENDWFELWYQPRVDLATKVLAGAEGLFRARHPEFGVISAADLLDSVKEPELLSLTARVLGRAMGDWKSFRNLGIPIEFSINIPTVALTKLSLFSIFWDQAPDATDWPGITLELNEDDVIPNMNFAFAAMKQLHKQKIKLALDSFGLCYEELSRYKELPFAEMKIDRSLIFRCEDDAHQAGLCETIIEFAHRYGAKVVAEGVETASQAAVLRKLGCDYAQGHLFARPMTKSDFLSLLQQRSTKAAARSTAA